ncbi:MAG: HEPN/Toprim-associated domain-containing protein [Aliidongia sp.]
MGSMIHLTLGRVELDWGKNEGFQDHRALFRPDDLTEIPYYYAASVDEPSSAHLPLIRKSNTFSYRLISEMKEGYSAPLKVVAMRLLLLGHTDDCCRHEFELLCGSDCANHDFSFDELKMILAASDFSGANFVSQLGSEDFADFFAEHVLPGQSNGSDTRLKRGGWDNGGIDGLSAYTIIRLLALNPTAQDLPVTWQFADVADGGWVSREWFREPSNRLVDS